LALSSKEECNICIHRNICKPEKRGKKIVIRPENEVLKRRREEMKTKEFKEDNHKRNGIEGTISGIVRGQGLRRSRYRGKSKTRLHLKFAGAAANIQRLHRKLYLSSNETMEIAA
jgi:hypothetical protein